MNVRTNGPEPTAIVPRNEIICADAETALGGMPAGCIDAVVTSPPYFQQRDYGADRQIGREPTPAEYIARLVRLFQQVRRVLAETGTVWIVIGDKYVNGQLLGLPWRVAIALQDDGWQLRNDVIWHKPNAMPSAAKRRLTTDHEYVFLFTKSAGYYFDGDSIREPHVTFSEKSRMRGGRGHFFQRGSTPEQGKNGGQANLHDGRWDQAFHPLGRNKRTVWSISLGKCREAHFAVFPEPLVEICIQAGSPPGGLVLDPFLGSGTTAIVARRLGRDFLGIDCQAEYCEMARKRLEQSG